MAGRRSPARFLAPIALLAFAFALYTVVQNTREPAGGNSSSPSATATATSSKTAKKKSSSSKKKKIKTYTVKSGDTPSGIAEENGISLEQLMKLNPDLDPATLAPGQKVKLSE
jgi:LysM repeat protein